MTIKDYHGTEPCLRCNGKAAIAICYDKISKRSYHYCKKCKDLKDLEFDWEREGETTRESNVICPYCDYEYDDYDSYSFVDDGQVEEHSCQQCGKKFDIEVDTTVYFSTKRSICEMPQDYKGDDE
jgi:transcription elongation factor Elf1